MSKAVNEQGDFLFNMPFGPQETSNLYLNYCFQTLINHEKILLTSNSLNDHRIIPQTQLLIGLINNREIFDEMMRRFEGCLEIIDQQECSEHKKDIYRMSLSSHTKAEVTRWVSLTFQFSSENIIVPI